jgi:hypothetical protein
MFLIIIPEILNIETYTLLFIVNIICLLQTYYSYLNASIGSSLLAF